MFYRLYFRYKKRMIRWLWEFKDFETKGHMRTFLTHNAHKYSEASMVGARDCLGGQLPDQQYGSREAEPPRMALIFGEDTLSAYAELARKSKRVEDGRLVR